MWWFAPRKIFAVWIISHICYYFLSFFILLWISLIPQLGFALLIPKQFHSLHSQQTVPLNYPKSSQLYKVKAAPLFLSTSYMYLYTHEGSYRTMCIYCHLASTQHLIMLVYNRILCLMHLDPLFYAFNIKIIGKIYKKNWIRLIT
jgi:hypothetical protein